MESLTIAEIARSDFQLRLDDKTIDHVKKLDAQMAL
jgi:hypothetical protein